MEVMVYVRPKLCAAKITFPKPMFARLTTEAAEMGLPLSEYVRTILGDHYRSLDAIAALHAMGDEN